jgi:hypothetical protein
MLSPTETDGLMTRIRNYLRFREDTDRFLRNYLSAICTQACYESRQSACCGREGITTFFADVAINALMSPDEQVDRLLDALHAPDIDSKCVYLGHHGCLWRIKPIVCEMFLCKRASTTVFDNNAEALTEWKRLKRREKRYAWPSRPVLFDNLEAYFMGKGCQSSLMYFHNSPGLLRVKAMAREKAKKRSHF